MTLIWWRCFAYLWWTVFFLSNDTIWLSLPNPLNFVINRDKVGRKHFIPFQVSITWIGRWLKPKPSTQILPKTTNKFIPHTNCSLKENLLTNKQRQKKFSPREQAVITAHLRMQPSTETFTAEYKLVTTVISTTLRHLSSTPITAYHAKHACMLHIKYR